MHSTDPHYPIEYTLWEVEFFGRKFRVTPDVLIPRLETEWLVRRARTLLQKSNNLSTQKTTIIDIGTGSWIIGVSLADLAEEVIFLDISEKALEVARKNFRTHFPNKKAKFLLSDLLSNIPIYQYTNILLVANLPYIKADDWEHMSEDTRYEPELALFGGEHTGFELYERLFEQLSTFNLQPVTVMIEFGFDQRVIAEETLKKYGWKYAFFTDYAGIERFAEINIDL